MGINVYYHTVVGDNPQRLRAAVELARSRADIIITTGGLGPTCDDLTKQVLAEAFGRPLVFTPECADAIRTTLQIRSGDDGKQSSAGLAAEGCHILDNPWGTAPAVPSTAGTTMW